MKSLAGRLRAAAAARSSSIAESVAIARLSADARIWRARVHAIATQARMAGKTTRNVVPDETVLSQVTVPPIAAVSSATMARPSPEPEGRMAR